FKRDLPAAEFILQSVLIDHFIMSLPKFAVHLHAHTDDLEGLLFINEFAHTPGSLSLKLPLILSQHADRATLPKQNGGDAARLPLRSPDHHAADAGSDQPCDGE